MTAHIEAKKEEIAKTVIMPGDPKRAKYIAEKFLEDYRCVNEVRGMLAFTGKYKDKTLTVMASGMGMPSIGIYSYELFKFYDVENIIRVGSVGSYKEEVKLFDCVLVNEAYSDSSFAKVQAGENSNILKPSEELNKKIEEKSKKLNIPLHVGRIYSSDVFYAEDTDFSKMSVNNNCIGTEMESFALFHNANVLGKKAACLLTVSNNFVTNEETTSEEREKGFNQMIKIALELDL